MSPGISAVVLPEGMWSIEASWMEVELVGHQTTRHIWLTLNIVYHQKCTISTMHGNWIMDRAGSLRHWTARGHQYLGMCGPRLRNKSCLTTRASIRGNHGQESGQMCKADRLVHTKSIIFGKMSPVNIPISNISSEFTGCFEWSSVENNSM